MPSAGACYVYAIVPRDAVLPTTAGTGITAGLTLVGCRTLAAVTRHIGDERPARVVDELLHHEAVVEAVRAASPALPVRFGTVFRDATAVAGALEAHHEALAADLLRLGDRLEMGVTALWDAPDTVVAADDDRGGDSGAERAGTRYLRARAVQFLQEDALAARARTVAAEVDAALGAVARDRRASTLPTPRIALRVAYLLAPEDLDAFRQAFDAMRRTMRGVRVLMSGPWPPYSFVARPGEAGDGRREARFTELAQRLTEAVQERGG